MKRCPQCRIDYFDDSLEFCLDDGARLFTENSTNDEFPTITKPAGANPTKAETVVLSASVASEFGARPESAPATAARTERPKVSGESNSADAPPLNASKWLEIAPLILALAHNWWQWIYLEKQYYSSFAAYVFSANFLMWLVLLIAGAAIGLLSLKQSRHKAFTYSGLVILAINLILFLVPRR